MKVYMVKDVEKVGIAGEVFKVSDGFAQNYLIPRGLAIEVTPTNAHQFEKKTLEIKNRKAVIESKTSMLAQKIGDLKLTLKRKLHDDNKLYGSIAPHEIADLLATEGIKVAKNQIIFDKAIKEAGTYEVIVKLSNNLQPKCTVKIVAE